MKLLTFKHLNTERLGWLQEDGKTVLSVNPSDITMPQSMLDLIEGGSSAREQIVSGQETLERFDYDDIKIIEPIEPGGIFCVGLNYSDHAKEVGLERSEYPTLFWRLPRNHVAHGEPLWVPKLSNTLDWEAELVVVIGKGGRHITADRALEHVYGYSIYNEGSVRGYQDHSSQFGLGKNFHASAAFGPVIVTADEFGDPYSHDLKTTIDGEVVQSASVSLMLHTIEDVIAYLSSSMNLQAGDIICTGTPAGVGVAMRPRRFLKDGEVVEISISGIGTLSNPVQAEPS